MDIFGKFASRGGFKTPSGKLEKIKQQLQGLATGTPADTQAANKVGGGETIVDDGVVPADKAAQIARDEGLIKAALELFGVDYDALIKMDGESVYARAVKAKPDILREVLEAENPVLAALKVALGFKPFADFTAKYGDSPDSIKAAMKAEVLQELEQKALAEASAKPAGKPVFSGNLATHGGGKPAAPRKGKLTDVFGK